MVESTLWADRIDGCQLRQRVLQGDPGEMRMYLCEPVHSPGLGRRKNDTNLKVWRRHGVPDSSKPLLLMRRSTPTRNPAQAMDTPTQARSSAGKTVPPGLPIEHKSPGPNSHDALTQMVTSMVKMVQAGSTGIH